MTIYTIGHSNRPAEHLVDRLRRHGVRTLVDVRSTPFSSYNPQFNRPDIARTLAAAGTPYIWLGHSLGGTPESPSLRSYGRPDYDKIRATERYQNGISDLLRGVSSPIAPLALMCSEQDPTDCHRRKLVGADLVARGHELVHIMGDGALVRELDLRDRTGENQPTVFDVFGDM